MAQIPVHFSDASLEINTAGLTRRPLNGRKNSYDQQQKIHLFDSTVAYWFSQNPTHFVGFKAIT
jgi:hypothetical protein